MRSLKSQVTDNKAFLLFLFVFFVFRGSFADHMRVPSGSMLPNIQIGDHIFVNKLAYRVNLPFTQVGFDVGSPSPGEVVVFRHPHQRINMVKRLIAGPGDHLEVKDGFVKVNGRAIERATEGSTDLLIPKDHYFFMGDNRANSSDSRSWGLVSHELLIGRAERVIFNLAFDSNWTPSANLERIGFDL